jgi:hypothetical protein
MKTKKKQAKFVGTQSHSSRLLKFPGSAALIFIYMELLLMFRENIIKVLTVNEFEPHPFYVVPAPDKIKALTSPAPIPYRYYIAS